MMRAFTIEAPGVGRVRDVPAPVPGALDAVVDIEAVGLCGTDLELYDGTMPYFDQGLARYPLRPGHEWAGTVRAVGEGVHAVSPGDRVVGDTFIGCGTCERCLSGRHHVCAAHIEVGVRGGYDGALAEQLLVPARVLHRVPADLTAAEAAFVEPGSCALRGVKLAGAAPGLATLVWGAGTIGTLAAQSARAYEAEVTIVVHRPEDAARLDRLGFDDVVTESQLGDREFAAVIEATGDATVPEQALDRLAPGGRLALIGLPPRPVGLDVAQIVLHDRTVVGVLGGSCDIDETIEMLASGRLEVTPMIAAKIGLDDVDPALANRLRSPRGIGCKIQVHL